MESDRPKQELTAHYRTKRNTTELHWKIEKEQ